MAVEIEVDQEGKVRQQHSSFAESRFVISHGCLSQELEQLWRQHLERVDDPSHYNAPEFFCEPYWEGLQPFAVLALEEGRVVAVVTGIHVEDQIICGASSRPQICIEKTADELAATHALVEGLMCEAGSCRLITLFAWSATQLQGLQQEGYRRSELEGNVVLDLRRGADALFGDFHENRKRNIRLASRRGVEVCEERTAEDLAAYWEVYSAWRNTTRKAINHNRSFAALEKVHDMRQNHRRFLARYEGRVIAATGVRFFPGGMIEYANNCSLDKFLHLRPNDLLIWKTIEWACSMGFSRYSLGGAHPFLKKCGGTVVPICRCRLDRTFLHRYDLKDGTTAIARRMFHCIPMPIKDGIRMLLRKAG
jgi:GNAT acetyltransferase-like protein